MRTSTQVKIAVVAVASGALVAAASGSAHAARLTTHGQWPAFEDRIGTHTNPTYLSPTGGVRTTVMHMRLPQGAYVLTASGDLVNFGPSDFTRCQITVNGNQVAAVSTKVGEPGAPGANGAAGSLEAITMTGGAFVGPWGADVDVRCWHDYTNGAQPYFDNRGSLWAHRTDSLHVGPAD